MKVNFSDLSEPIVKNESSIQNFLRLKVKPFVDHVRYVNLCPTGSQPGKLYGMCKVHKEGYPVRPVISMLSTAEYNIAKWLDNYIKPNIPNTYSIASTNEFLEGLKNVIFDPKDQIVSFDVVSLFTNIPLAETIDIVVESLYSETSKIVPPVDKKVFKRLLQIATGGIFMYKDGLYRQVDGVAMGSPLGPSLANFFLGHIEEKIFKDLQNPPTVYLRYVDDIFAVFRSDTSFNPFFDLLNKQHPFLKFTFEEARGSFPFLNVELEINGESVDTWVFRKKTHTGVLLNFSACVPNSWKTGLIKCMLYSAKLICSTDVLFNKEVERLREMFASNGYPKVYFDNILEKFLCSLKDKESVVNQVKEKVERRYILGIPYVGKASRDYKKKVAALIKEHLDVDMFAYYTSHKVSRYFSLKSVVPSAMKANVVYKFSCLCDTGLYYIGQTKRHLAVRAKDHITPKVNSNSEIQKHIFDCNGCKRASLSVDHFSILKQCVGVYDTRISEALLIKELAPKLNKQQFRKGESYLLRVF